MKKVKYKKKGRSLWVNIVKKAKGFDELDEKRIKAIKKVAKGQKISLSRYIAILINQDLSDRDLY
jgi:hypothetical protein